jgi:hypothetical protein
MNVKIDGVKMIPVDIYIYPLFIKIKARVERKKRKDNMLGEDRSTLTADALARWFQTFESKYSSFIVQLFPYFLKQIANITIDGDNLRCLTSNSNLQDIWQQIIRHCHPSDHVK